MCVKCVSDLDEKTYNIYMSEVWKYLENDEKDPYKRGIKFEKIYVKKYLEYQPLFSKIYKKVLLWEEWEERPFKTDIGIDLVCFGYDNKITAVQAKAYNPESSISKPDIDSFITASNSDLFSHRLLIGTTNKIGKNAKAIINNEKRIPFQTHLLSDLEESNFINICKTSFQKKDLENNFKPYPHQLEAISKSTKYFKGNNIGQLIMACGSGKTLTSFWIAEKNNSKKVLFLAPSISLLAQTLTVWINNSKNKKKNFFVVCSDETAGIDNENEFTSDYAFPSTTDINQINNFINSNEEYVIFSTYQSSKTVLKAAKENKTKFDITICDESHRLTGKVNENYGTILSKNFPTKLKLFMTATPRIISYGLKKAAKGRDIELISMDDENIFGKVIYELTFGEAINKKLLADYKIIVTGVSNKEIEKNEFIKVNDKTIDIQTYAKAVTLKKVLKKYNLKKVITFHSYIKSASLFSELLNNLKLSSNFISGTHNIRERKELVKKLERKTKEVEILSNARVLSEGIDLPELDCISFIDPKTSVVDIVQAVGRAIRASKDKKKIGYIVIPILLDDSKSFETVYKTVIAMRSHDARMSEELDKFRIQMGNGTNLSNLKIPNLIIDLPTYVDSKFKVDLISKTIEVASETWLFWFGLLQKYSEENGHANVPGRYFQDGFYLGKWVQHQRSYFKGGNLSEERINLLNTIDGWSFDPQKDNFEIFFKLLSEYLDIHKKMPTSGFEYKGIDLMSKVLAINHQRKQGKYDLNRIKRLNSLTIKGFGWSKDDIAFEKNFSDLKTFSRREKNSYPDVKHIETEGGVQLGRFANNIRKTYWGEGYSTTSLDSSKIKRFEKEIPYWSWTREKDYKFNLFMEEIKIFLNDHLFAELRQSSDLGKKQSQIWVRKNISPERIKQLKQLEDFAGIKVYGLKKSNVFKENSKKIKKIIKKTSLTKSDKEYISEVVLNLKRMNKSYPDELARVLNKKLKK